MILPPTSQIDHHHKVTNVTMSPISLSPMLMMMIAKRSLSPEPLVLAIFATSRSNSNLFLCISEKKILNCYFQMRWRLEK